MQSALKDPSPIEAQLLLNGTAAIYTGPGDVEHGDTWGDDRTVRAEALLAVLSSASAADASRVDLRGVRITDFVDLRERELMRALDCSDCWFDDELRLTKAKLPGLVLRHCRVPRLSADGVICRGDVDLTESSIRGVELAGANIAGALRMIDADLRSGVQPDVDGLALDAREAKIGRDVRLEGAKLSVRGGVDFSRATVGGAFLVVGGTFVSPGHVALQADEATITADVRIGHVEVTGAVSLAAASVGRSLVLERATIDAPAVACFNAARAHVGGDVGLDDVTSRGSVYLTDADVAGSLFTAKGLLDGDVFPALVADGLQAGRVHLQGTHVVGAVRMARAELRDTFMVQGVTISRGGLELPGAQVRSALQLDFAVPPEGLVDLGDAHTAELIDRPTTWPSRLQLNGLEYQRVCRLEDDENGRAVTIIPDDARTRLRWLARASASTGYAPQPYEQLAGMYQRLGRPADAATVSLAGERERRRWLNPFARAAGVCLDAINGYGYRPWRTIAWYALLLAAGTLAFASLHPAEFLPPDSPTSPGFHPFVFTLDLLIPPLDLNQRSTWEPLGFAHTLATTYTVLGWLLTTAIVVPALSGLVRR